MKRQQWIGLLGAVATLVCGSAFADETVNIGGSRAVLIKPNAPLASVILCEARAYHGFNGVDGQVVGLAAGFH
jgi:hypothetical protein